MSIVRVVLLLSVPSVSLMAQRVDVLAVVGAGGARVDSVGGVVLNATITARSRWLQVALTPVEFITHSANNAPFLVNDVAGADVCREGNSRPLAGRRACVGTSARFGASGALAVRVPGAPLFVGYGNRVSAEGVTGFGTLAVHTAGPFSIPWTATAQVGGQYLSIVLSAGTHLTRRRR